MRRLALLFACLACATPRTQTAEPVFGVRPPAPVAPRPREPAVVELPDETLHVARGTLAPVTIAPDGQIDSLDSRFVVNRDGRVEDRGLQAFATVDRAGHVVLEHGDATMDLADDGLVRIVADRTSEIDMREYLSRYPREQWRIIELAFFLDVLYLAPARVK